MKFSQRLPHQPHLLEFHPEGREVICLCRVRGAAEIHNLDLLSLHSFRALCHEAEGLIVTEMANDFSRLCQTGGRVKPQTLPLTKSEREVLIAGIRSLTQTREEIHPWANERHEIYNGMMIVVCPDAETKRREMIES